MKDAEQLKVVLYLGIIILIIITIQRLIKSPKEIPLKTPFESVCEQHPNDKECLELDRLQGADFEYYHNPTKEY